MFQQFALFSYEENNDLHPSSIHTRAGMNSFASLLNHPDISFSPIPDSIKVDNPATGETLAFVRTTHSDDLKLLIQKAEAAVSPDCRIAL